MKILIKLIFIGMSIAWLGARELLAAEENPFAKESLTKEKEVKLRKVEFNLEDNVIAEGYDVVAYFTENKAIKGSKKYPYIYKGVTYHFNNPKNRNLFTKKPENYPVAYGGWCAYAMGKNKKVSINPKNFKVIGNRVYLFYNSIGINTLKKWNKDEKNIKLRADQNWKHRFESKLPADKPEKK